MYRQTDIDTIKANMNNIQNDATRQKLEKLEPTMEEFKNVYSVIIDYIRKNKRKVYGGYAQNHLIKMKKPSDVFYSELDLADIEFYSYEPLKDVVELCDLLHSKGFKYVQGSDGVHEETYKIFVNFQNYCDLSYMPKNVYDNLPTIIDDSIIYTHPHFMMVDAFRVYADPLTSYFRLDKTFNRFTTLMKHYPFDMSFVKKNLEYNTKLDKNKITELKRFVRHHILHHSELIVIGHYAYNYLVKKTNLDLEFEYYPYYQAISINYDIDKVNIEKFIKNKYGNKITTKEFNPYFQFYDKHIEYYYEGTCILKLYGHNNRCIVNKESEKKKVFFGTFQLVFLYLLIDYQYAHTRRDDKEHTNYMILITRLLKARENYLEAHNKTVLDTTPFQEFTLQCIGSTEDPLRMARLDARKKREEHKQIVFRYDPKGTPGKVPKYNFLNTSGNEILKK